jgi:glycosyltransferase involved in cell wall biosynthesis
MATCRVYLTTYRRCHLLRRSLASLASQTFTDWVCELHNDAPDDDSPRTLLEEMNDARVSYHPHKENYGPVKSFNLFFRPIHEPFFSILEDDNWWEPTLLERLVELLKLYPTANLAWANMRFWKEEVDGSWLRTNKTVWDQRNYRAPQVFRWPHPKQVYAALHSIGSMMVRTSQWTTRPVPESLPFFGIDPVRERLYPCELILEPAVLANFAMTRQTARKTTVTEDMQVSILLAWSFLRHVDASDEFLGTVWKNAQGWPVRSSNVLVIAHLLARSFRKLFRHASPVDWLFFFASWIKRPVRMYKLVRSISTLPEVASFLDNRTAELSANLQSQRISSEPCSQVESVESRRRSLS